MRTCPDPPFASNAAGRPFSRVGALSQVVSVSPSKAYIPFHSFPFSSPSVCSKSMAAGLALGSGSERNRLIGAGRGDGLPAVDPPHMDLARREQRPEQHRGAFCRGQDGLGFDPALELLVQAFDGIGGARALPLARGQPRECEQVAAGFLQAVGDGAVPKPPFAQEGPPALLDLRGRRGVDHVGIVGRDLFVQPLRGMGEQAPMLVNQVKLPEIAVIYFRLTWMCVERTPRIAAALDMALQDFEAVATGSPITATMGIV